MVRCIEAGRLVLLSNMARIAHTDIHGRQEPPPGPAEKAELVKKACRIGRHPRYQAVLAVKGGLLPNISRPLRVS